MSTGWIERKKNETKRNEKRTGDRTLPEALGAPRLFKSVSVLSVFLFFFLSFYDDVDDVDVELAFFWLTKSM